MEYFELITRTSLLVSCPYLNQEFRDICEWGASVNAPNI